MCSWTSVRPRSAPSTGPVTVCTVVMTCLPSSSWRRGRRAGRPRARAATASASGWCPSSTTCVGVGRHLPLRLGRDASGRRCTRRRSTRSASTRRGGGGVVGVLHDAEAHPAEVAHRGGGELVVAVVVEDRRRDRRIDVHRAVVAGDERRHQLVGRGHRGREVDVLSDLHRAQVHEVRDVVASARGARDDHPAVRVTAQHDRAVDRVEQLAHRLGVALEPGERAGRAPGWARRARRARCAPAPSTNRRGTHRAPAPLSSCRRRYRRGAATLPGARPLQFVAHRTLDRRAVEERRVGARPTATPRART